MMSSNRCGKLDNALQEVGNTNIKFPDSYYCSGKQSRIVSTLSGQTLPGGYKVRLYADAINVNIRLSPDAINVISGTNSKKCQKLAKLVNL